MADPAKTIDQNILPVQALFNLDGTFNTFIGQGQPFYATLNPSQSGLAITNSTIDSTTIGATTPSTGVFTNILTNTGQITTSPSGNTDIANKAYVDAVAQGLNPKQAVKCATTANITLSGLQTIDGYTTLVGDRVLVKNETSTPTNGIYIAAAGAWTRAVDMDVWAEVPGAYCVVLNGTQNSNTGWVSTSSDTGTIGTTPITFVQFSGISTYYAGTGLSLSANTFSITNTGVTAANYGSASSVPVLAVNAQGQITSASSSTIAIANTQVSGLGTMSTQNANSVAVTGGTINSTTIGGTIAAAVTGTTITANTQFTGSGAGLTGTATSLSIGGNAATATNATSATTATTATNLASGAAGSVPYQSASGTTAMLAAGSNGQVLTLSSGLPVWNTPTVGTVTSVNGTGTVSGISLSGTVTSSGSLTLGGTLDLSSPPVIGGTTPNTITGSTITANTKFVSQDYYAQSILGGNLRTSGGTSLLNWDGGGSGNITVNGGLLANPSNKNISLAPTGTGTVTINPATAGTMDNVAVGATTAAAGTFTNLRLNTNLSLNGSTGSSGQVLTSNGSSVPTWTTPTAYATVTDDTTTNATRYPLFAAATSGNLTTEYTSSTKYQFNPSTGVLTATQFTGSGAGLTSIPNSALTNSSITVGSTAISLGSSATTIAGLTSVTSTTFVGALTGNASTATTATTATGALNVQVTDNTSSSSTFYPTMSPGTTGSTNYALGTSSTKLSFVPNTGVLSATSFSGGQYIANQSISGSTTQGAFAYGTLNGSDSGIFASYQTSIAGYAYMALQNTSSNAAATTDIALYNDTAYLGKYIDIGINSSAFTGTGNFSLANAGYIYTNGGDLVLGTYSSNGIHFIINNGATDAVTINTSGAIAVNGSYGTSGYLLQTNGNVSAPTWVAPSTITAGTATNATNIAITDDLTTNAVVYPTWVTSNTGNLPAKVTSTKLKFNPSTGALTASQLIIAP